MLMNASIRFFIYRLNIMSWRRKCQTWNGYFLLINVLSNLRHQQSCKNDTFKRI